MSSCWRSTKDRKEVRAASSYIFFEGEGVGNGNAWEVKFSNFRNYHPFTMPKRKAAPQLSGLIDSGDEDDIQMSSADEPAEEVEEGPPPKRAKGRPKAAAANKPARRKPRATVTAPTRRAAPKKKPPAKQVVEEPPIEEDEASELDGVNGIATQDEQQDELDSPKTVLTRQEPSPAKTRRTRGGTAKKVTVDDGFEYTPTGTRQIKPEEIPKAEATTKKTGGRGRKATTKTKVQEVHEPLHQEEEDVSDAEEPIFPDDQVQVEEELPPSPSKHRANGDVGVKAQPTRRPKAGGTSDNEPGGSEPAMRRKLGEMTKKFENLDARYRNLRAVGVLEANANFEKLRKQSEAATNGMFPFASR
jgi:hypothetical protein